MHYNKKMHKNQILISNDMNIQDEYVGRMIKGVYRILRTRLTLISITLIPFIQRPQIFLNANLHSFYIIVQLVPLEILSVLFHNFTCNSTFKSLKF